MEEEWAERMSETEIRKRGYKMLEPYPMLLSYWMLVGSGLDAIIVFTYVPQGESSRLQWVDQEVPNTKTGM